MLIMNLVVPYDSYLVAMVGDGANDAGSLSLNEVNDSLIVQE